MHALSPQSLLDTLSAIHEQTGIAPPNRLVIAYSGGLDTQALLHIVGQIRHLAPIVNVKILAFHVNHGLHPDADQWERAGAEQCAHWGITFKAQKVAVRQGPGLSLEEEARNARYDAMRRECQPGDWWLTGHHLDDQAETTLLQLLRGAGLRGMAAMPRVQALAEGWLIRPLLETGRQAIAAYAEAHALTWIDDPSNSDLRFDRNFLRHRILPLLKQRWPGCGVAFARSAALSGEAIAILDDAAEKDFLHCRAGGTERLSIAALRSLPEARLKNLLTWWPRRLGLSIPQRAHIAQIRNILDAAQDAVPKVSWPGAEVRRYDDGLFAMHPLPAIDKDWSISWEGRQALDIPGGGRISVAIGQGRGVALHRCVGPLKVTFRQGGERMAPARRQGRHTLKNLFQEARIPPWVRERLPVVATGDGDIVFVPGLGVAEPYRARPGEAAVEWSWHSIHECQVIQAGPTQNRVEE